MAKETILLFPLNIILISATDQTQGLCFWYIHSSFLCLVKVRIGQEGVKSARQGLSLRRG